MNSDLTLSDLLTMSRGTLALSGNILTLGADLDMSSANAATIAIGTGTLDGATNNRTVALSNANAAITQGTGTLSCAGLTMTAGTYTCTGNSVINSSGNVSVTGGTFTYGTSTLTMTGAGTTIRFAGRSPYNLVVNSPGGTVSITASGLTVIGNLTVDDGAATTTRFNLGGQNLTVGSAGGGGTITVGLNDILETTAAETINAYGNIDFSAGGDNFTQTNSTVILLGNTGTTIDSPEETFYRLTINKGAGAATVTMNSDLTLSDLLTMSRGTLNQTTTSSSISGQVYIDNGGTWNCNATSDINISLSGSPNALTIVNGGFWNCITNNNITVSIGGSVINNGTIDFDGGGAGAGGADTISIRSTIIGTQRDWSGSGTFEMDDVDVRDQTCITGTPAYIPQILNSEGTDSGNNINWNITYIAPATISGTVYSDEGTTPITSDRTVRLVVYYTSTIKSSFTTTAVAGTGVYNFTHIAVTNGTRLLVYIDNDALFFGSTANISDGPTVSALDIYQNHLIIKHEAGLNISDTDLNNLLYPSSAAPDADIKYTISGSDLAVDPSFEIYIANGSTFRPGGYISCGYLEVVGTLDASPAGSDIAVQGDWNNGGTFLSGNNTVTFNGTADQDFTPGASNYYNITVNKTAGSLTVLTNNVTQSAGGVLDLQDGTIDLNGRTWTLGANLSLGNANTPLFDLNNGTLTDGAATYALTVGQATLLADGTSNITVGDFTVNANANVDVGTGNFTVGVMSVTGGDFTQTGDELANTHSVTSLSVAGGACAWDAGDLAFAGPFSHTNGAMDFGNKTVTGVTTFDVTNPDGNCDLGGATITASGNVTISTTGAGGLIPGTSLIIMNGGNLSSDSALNNLRVNAACILQSNITLNGWLDITATGVLDVNDPSDFWITVAGNWTDAGTFNEYQGRVIFNGDGDTVAETFYNLELAGGNRTSSGDWTVTNGITLSGGQFIPGANTHQIAGSWDDSAIVFQAVTGTIILTSTNPDITEGAGNHFFNLTLTDGANMVTAMDCNGTLNFNGTLETNNMNIFVGVNWNNNGTGVFNEGTGTVTFDGNGTIQTDETFYGLVKDGAGTTTTVGAAITVHNTLTIIAGILDGGSVVITFNGHTWQTQAAGTFNGNGGEVVFENTTATPETSILGSNDFFNFTCTDPGAILLFEFDPPPHPPPGTEVDVSTTVNGLWHIEGAAGAGNEITLDSTNPPNQWIISANGSAVIMYTVVRNSNAFPNSITPHGSCSDGGNNTNWFFTIPVETSNTLDLDHNGKIDAIDAQVNASIVLNNPFPATPAQFEVTIEGYAVAGYTRTGVPDNTFRILLTEKQQLDTDATPAWHIVTNTVLTSQLGGRLVVTPTEQTPTDNAEPVIGYTLAAAGRNQVFVHFSEPVFDTATPPDLDPLNFAFPAGTNPISVEQINSREYLLTFATAITVDDIINSVQILFSNIEDQVNLPLSTATNRVSDLAVGVPGSEPILPNLLYDATPREPGPEGIGYITIFDGNWWIQDFDTIQVLEADVFDTLGVSDFTIYWDTNVGSQYVDNRLWLPPFEDDSTQNGFSGLVPYENPNTSNIPENGPFSDPARFNIDTSDAEMVDETVVEFFIRFNAVTPELYSARLERPNASDWYRSVRPWAFGIHKAEGNQKGKVTIYNNVINPNAGELVKIHYILKGSGSVTIQVFTLAGDIVRLLFRGNLGAGEHSTAWDGRNTGGRVVAKGLYFIRIVGPGVDETRKVLVVK